MLSSRIVEFRRVEMSKNGESRGVSNEGNMSVLPCEISKGEVRHESRIPCDLDAG